MKKFGLIGCVTLAAFAVGGTSTAMELLTNPGFEDTDTDGNVGDGWGAFGNAGFNAFFGPNGHASLFPDTVGNSGGIFQAGIAGTAGTEYDFTLADTRIESDFDAEVFFGLEFYDATDAVLLGSSLVQLADPGVEVNGGVYSHQAVAPAGTAFVRPIASFDTVLSSGGQRNVFVFEASLTAVPEPSSVALLGLGAAAIGWRRRRTA